MFAKWQRHRGHTHCQKDQRQLGCLLRFQLPDAALTYYEITIDCRRGTGRSGRIHQNIFDVEVATFAINRILAKIVLEFFIATSCPLVILLATFLPKDVFKFVFLIVE